MIDGTGVSVDEEKVKVISAFCKEDLMKEMEPRLHKKKHNADYTGYIGLA